VARSELLAQIAYGVSTQKGLGRRFHLEVEAAVVRAKAFSMHGKPSAGGRRRRLVTDSSFSVMTLRRRPAS